MPKEFYISKKSDGSFSNTKVYKEYLDELEHGQIKIVVSSMKKRSLPQNSFLHGVLIPEFRNALVSVGYDEVKNDKQAKDIMKKMFLTRQIVNKETGEYLEYIQDTSDCTKEEMGILYDEVVKFCLENMNYRIPLPNEQLMI